MIRQRYEEEIPSTGGGLYPVPDLCACGVSLRPHALGVSKYLKVYVRAANWADSLSAVWRTEPAHDLVIMRLPGPVVLAGRCRARVGCPICGAMLRDRAGGFHQVGGPRCEAIARVLGCWRCDLCGEGLSPHLVLSGTGPLQDRYVHCSDVCRDDAEVLREEAAMRRLAAARKLLVLPRRS